MPTINVYQNSKEFESKIKLLTKELKQYVAKELSGDSIKLDSDEISVRLIYAIGGGMLAKVEVEIHAAAFEERIKRQDEICLKTQAFIKDALGTDVKVWLILSELGHSWQNT